MVDRWCDRMAQYWLMKAEPSDYSYDDLERDGTAAWDGVRNHQAARNMRTMRRGDRVFFYRSVVEPAVVGLMEVVREAYEAPDDPKGSFVLVDLAPVRRLPREVSLRSIKAEPRLADLALVRQSRLSVSSVDEPAFRLIMQMAGADA
jgi:predicted RNA-binding protein with PUA-like domain